MATAIYQDRQIKDALIPLNEKIRMGIYSKSNLTEKVIP